MKMRIGASVSPVTDQTLHITLVAEVMMIPFFAFVEVNKLLGPGALQRLLLKRERPSP